MASELCHLLLLFLGIPQKSVKVNQQLGTNKA
jgi:hypothetical protein